MRAERSERALYFVVVAFLHSKNCYFFQYFVGTSDTLSVQMACLSAYMYRTNFQMYRQNFEKAFAIAIAPPPPGYASGPKCINSIANINFFDPFSDRGGGGQDYQA